MWKISQDTSSSKDLSKVNLATPIYYQFTIIAPHLTVWKISQYIYSRKDLSKVHLATQFTINLLLLRHILQCERFLNIYIVVKISQKFISLLNLLSTYYYCATSYSVEDFSKYM